MRTARYCVVAAALVMGLVAVSVTGSGGREAGESYSIDGAHTAVYFRITHLGMSYTYGRFNEVSGHLTAGDAAADHSFALTARTASVDTGNEKRDKHLRGPDFFSAKQYATISFKSTSVAVKDGVLQVSGDVTLHGVTRRITVPVKKMGEGKDPWGKYRVGFATEFKINRSDFGMKKMLNIVGDEVDLMISFEGVRKS